MNMNELNFLAQNFLPSRHFLAQNYGKPN